MNNDQTYHQLISVVLQDLECFIAQKIDQNLIYAMLEIKKYARKNQKNQHKSIDKKSQASFSQKNYSSRISDVSGHSQSKKQKSKQSDISQDILNGAESLNQIRKKGIKQKIYTQGFQNSNQQKSQHGRYSNPFPPINFQQGPKSHGVNIVPKLVGLVSSQQISDIQHPSGNNSRNQNKGTFRNYQRSIVQVQDDDDEFQDIVLNRLQKIQQKVNQMLRQKRGTKLQGLRHKANHSYHVPQYPLQAVGSGANIIYSNQLKDSEFYKHREPKYNKSTAIMTPKIYTFQNTAMKDIPSLSKKNILIKPNLTERINNPSKAVIQNYCTDNQQYGTYVVNTHARYQMPQNSQVIQDRQSHQNQQNSSQAYNKNKTLGHYRQSQDIINLQESDRINNNEEKKQQQRQEADKTKIKIQPLDPMSAFKYIPMSKANSKKPPNQQKYSQQKTQRQTANRHKIKVQSVNFVQRPKDIPKYIQNQQERRIYQPPVMVSQQKIYHRYQPYRHHHHQLSYNNGSVEIHRQPIVRNTNTNIQNQRYRSGRDSGVRNNRLENSGVKAYTQHDTYQNDLQSLSVASQKNLYSQIQKLKQITKQRQRIKLKKRQDEQQKRKIKIDNNQRANSTLDYRYYQKTQRPVYSNFKQEYNQQQQQQQIIVQGQYPQQQVVRVIKYGNDQRYNLVSPRSNRMENTQYVRYNNGISQQHRQRLGYQQRQPPVYILQESSGPSPRYYEQRINGNVNTHHYQNEQYYQHNQAYQSSKPVYQEEVKSQRKLSSGSLNSFKSIPYNNRNANNSHQLNIFGNQYMTQKRSVQYVVEKPTYYVRSENRSQY